MTFTRHAISRRSTFCAPTRIVGADGNSALRRVLVLLILSLVPLPTLSTLQLNAQPPHLWVPNAANPAFPNWPTISLNIYEKNTPISRSPALGIQLRDNSNALYGAILMGVPTASGMYSSFAGFGTKTDVVLNAVDAQDLIITNLSGSGYPNGTTGVGAIRFGTAPINGGTVPADIERMTILADGNVGVNQSAPVARLQVTNGSVLFNGGTGGTPMEGAGVRLMWIPAKKAFRAGEDGGGNWNDTNIGSGSFAVGSSMAKGQYSTAFGTASALGGSSFAVGGAEAEGPYSVAFGSLSNARGSHSLTTGFLCEANGGYSTALGYGSIATGEASFAQGNGSSAGGFGAVAFSAGQANGLNSVALSGGRADGSNSYAMGPVHAGGANSSATGLGTISSSYIEFATGRYNDTSGTLGTGSWVATDPLLSVGNGASTSDRSNALTILKNGNHGIGDHRPLTTRLLVKSGLTTDSTAALHVLNSSSASLLYVRDDGRVGIGTSAPGARLALRGPANASLSSLLLRVDSGAGTDPLFVIRNDGMIGIGTGDTPCADDSLFVLKVNGGMKAKEIIVEIDSAGWCDYVFDDDYPLMPLRELEREIGRLGHLPEIPSSDEVERTGVSVARMQALLLKKVEELTLHVIALEKENTALRARVDGLATGRGEVTR